MSDFLYLPEMWRFMAFLSPIENLQYTVLSIYVLHYLQKNYNTSNTIARAARYHVSQSEKVQLAQACAILKGA